MKIDDIIQRELDTLPVPYTIKKWKDHYAVVVEGHPPIIVAGNHGRTAWILVRHTVNRIRRLRKALGDKL